MKPYTRQLGARPGVQLNQAKDNTGTFVAGPFDQIFGMVGRFQRGRIDKAFAVDRGTRKKKLGASASTAISRLNEAMVHVYEALFNGATAGVISRLVPAAATNSYIVATAAASTALSLTTATTLPGTYAFAIKHMECFNDGIVVKINAAQSLAVDGTTKQPSSIVSFTLTDPASGEDLFSFTGSLDPAAVDESGMSYYLPSVVSAQTDLVEVTVYAGATTVATTANWYGFEADGVTPKVATALMNYFSEGGTVYANTDYDAAILRLKTSDEDFGYIASGGTRNSALISRLAGLGVEMNTQFAFDIDGSLSPAAAIAFMASLNLDTMYAQAYWAPLKADDPLNGGKDYLGTSGINVGKRCLRNADTDANGIAPKNWVIAGKDHPLSRTGIIQAYTPSENELNALAAAKINPVLFQRYNAGSSFVFTDSLTSAKTNGDKKLIAVAEMSSSLDDFVGKYGFETNQLPMEESVGRMKKFLENLFPALETAKWIKPSTDRTSEIYGKSFKFEVEPNKQRPNDCMDVRYWCHFDGTNRATYIQQTISK